MSSISDKSFKARISYPLFESIQQNMPFSETEWAYLLCTSIDSLLIFKTTPDFTFTQTESETIIKISEISILGIEVFQTAEKLKNWLELPCYALGQQKPVELLLNSYGQEKVTNELHKLYQDLFF